MTSGQFSSLHLEHASTVDRVADELRRALFDGEVESGTPLREVALADSLGVSRSTVREALAVLVAEGLAVREPNRGVSIASPDPASISDVCLVRLTLESSGIRRWESANAADREAVRSRLQDYADAAARRAPFQELTAAHLALHLSFVGLTGSPRLIAMAESVYAELRLALAQVDRIRRNTEAQVDSHTCLVDLIESGDTGSAITALEAHLADAEVAILGYLAL